MQLPGKVLLHIRASVFGKYLDPEQANYDQLVQNIIATVAIGRAIGTGTEAGTSTGGDGAFPFGRLLNKTGGDQGVMAYLNYLVFDKEGVLNEGQSGYVALSTGAREDGTGRPHEKLSKEIVVAEPGFAYIYLSNDNPEPLDVVFDDFEVEQVRSAIVQADDYYPFGLTFNSYKRESSIKNRYLYNDGSERIDDLDLKVDMTRYRIYDPPIGRWWHVDPKTDAFPEWTPYNYSFNNPIRWNDPLGDCPPCWASLVTAYYSAKAKYSSIFSKANPPSQRLISGTSGSVPSSVNMDSRTRTSVKIAGTANDVDKVVETGQELGKEIAKDGGSMLNATGDVLASAGIVVSAIPGGQAIGGAMVAVGEGLSLTGAAIEAVVDVSEGNVEKAVVDGAIEGATGAASGVVKQLRNTGKIDDVSNSILQGTNEASKQIGKFINKEVNNSDEEEEEENGN